jgi:hypothetical protein
MTKSDLVSPMELHFGLQSVFNEIMNRKRKTFVQVHVVSSKTGYGIFELTLAMTEIIKQPWVRHLETFSS